MAKAKVVYHKPLWIAGPLRINKEGDTKPGFWCIHPMENGNGLCGGNVLRLEDEVGDHSCVVPEGD